jgi:hypothetical protein
VCAHNLGKETGYFPMILHVIYSLMRSARLLFYFIHEQRRKILFANNIKDSEYVNFISIKCQVEAQQSYEDLALLRTIILLSLRKDATINRYSSDGKTNLVKLSFSRYMIHKISRFQKILTLTSIS